MATFENCIPLVLLHEGGFVNDPSDSGGATNYGISLNYLKDHPNYGDFNHDGIVDISDIRMMTKDQATVIYKQYWWIANNYGLIMNDSIALKILDFSVNSGPSRGNKYAQQACVNLGVNIAVDGNLGPNSIKTINALTSTPNQVQAYLNMYRQMQIQFYNNIVAKNSDLSKFLVGWTTRVRSC